MDLWIILSDIVQLLAASLILGMICSRLGLSPIIGYLLAGMFLGGPGSLHVVQSKAEIEAIAELGVALLLFTLGLEFSLERLKELGQKPLIGGIAQVILTLAVGAAAAWWLLALALPESIAFGAMIALSSTALVLRMLMERGELDMPHGRNSLGVLLTQDMAVVPLALLMALLGGGGGAFDVAFRMGKLIVLVSGLVLGLFLLSRLAVCALGTLTLLRNRELTVIFAVVTGLGAAWAAHEAGISPALGAFIAGMVLGSSAFATQIRADVSSLRMVLLTLFFGAAGMVADPIWIFRNLDFVAVVLVLLTLGKALIIWAIFQWLGHRIRVAIATGVCLAQVGEFAFVLGSMGRTSGVVSHDSYALVVSITIVSFFLSAFLVPKAPAIGNAVASLFGMTGLTDTEERHIKPPPDVVIIGFGAAGQLASAPFVDSNARVVVIELNQDGVRQARELGFVGEIGDATQNEVLEHAGIYQAKAIVISIPHHKTALDILSHVRQHAPHAHVVVRSRYKLHSASFVRAGAHAVVGDEEKVGEAMAQHLAQWMDARSVGPAD